LDIFSPEISVFYSLFMKRGLLHFEVCILLF
jgi:hypothetical protein